jgi:hypothetical protein
MSSTGAVTDRPMESLKLSPAIPRLDQPLPRMVRFTAFSLSSLRLPTADRPFPSYGLSRRYEEVPPKRYLPLCRVYLLCLLHPDTFEHISFLTEPLIALTIFNLLFSASKYTSKYKEVNIGTYISMHFTFVSTTNIALVLITIIFLR